MLPLASPLHAAAERLASSAALTPSALAADRQPRRLHLPLDGLRPAAAHFLSTQPPQERFSHLAAAHVFVPLPAGTRIEIEEAHALPELQLSAADRETVERFWAASARKDQDDLPQLAVRGASCSPGVLHLHCERTRFSVLRALATQAIFGELPRIGRLSDELMQSGIFQTGSLAPFLTREADGQQSQAALFKRKDRNWSVAGGFADIAHSPEHPEDLHRRTAALEAGEEFLVDKRRVEALRSDFARGVDAQTLLDTHMGAFGATFSDRCYMSVYCPPGCSYGVWEFHFPMKLELTAEELLRACSESDAADKADHIDARIVRLMPQELEKLAEESPNGPYLAFPALASALLDDSQVAGFHDELPGSRAGGRPPIHCRMLEMLLDPSSVGR